MRRANRYVDETTLGFGPTLIKREAEDRSITRKRCASDHLVFAFMPVFPERVCPVRDRRPA